MNRNIQPFNNSILFLTILLALICNVFSISAEDNTIEEKPIVVVVASFQNKKLHKKNLNSIFSQKYENFRVIYTDDCSPDNTGAYVEKYIQSHHLEDRITLIRNKKRMGALANDYNAIHSCADDEIIVIVDGDDWLPHDGVLALVNKTYASGDIWLTHGKFVHWPANRIEPLSKAYPADVIKNNSYRQMNCPLPLRTFYAWLFKKIKIEDLTLKGEFFMRTRDAAMMYPLIEMAAERHAFIDEITYIYNGVNPISDWRADPREQVEIAHHIQHVLKPYKRLQNRNDNP